MPLHSHFNVATILQQGRGRADGETSKKNVRSGFFN